jgi:hypothetical protein
MDNTIDFKRLYELSIIEKEELLKKIDEYKQNIEELQINLEKYKNTQTHELHGVVRCPNTFKTAYDIENEIIYCEDCYKKEVF